jgi:hypothetical protein
MNTLLEDWRMIYNVAVIEDAPQQAFALKEALEIGNESVRATTYCSQNEIIALDASQYNAIVIDRHLFDGREAYDDGELDGIDGEAYAFELIKNGYSGQVIITSGDWEFVAKRNKPQGLVSRLFLKKKEPTGITYIKKGSAETIAAILAAITKGV